MSSITFDTLKFVERLTAAGVPEAQAKAEAQALAEALSESASNILATKHDITDLKQEMAEIKADIRLLKWMLGVVLGGIVALVLRSFFPA